MMSTKVKVPGVEPGTNTRMVDSDATSVIAEIDCDHAMILRKLEQLLIECVADGDMIADLVVTLGAHHLAEEEILDAALSNAMPELVGPAQIHHLLLDDLMHTIACGGYRDVPLRYHLVVLRDMLQQHFRSEENLWLEASKSVLSDIELIALGRRYRAYFDKVLPTLRRPSNKNLVNRVTG